MVCNGDRSARICLRGDSMIDPTLPGAPPASYLRMQFFPAKISPLDLPHTDLKVFVTNSHFIVVGSVRNAYSVIVSQPIDEYLGFNRTTRMWHLSLEDGVKISIGRADSCGCGSKLRGFALYPGIKYA